MHATRFDTLARALHDTRSRRAALATVLRGALAAVSMPFLAAADAQAQGDETATTQGSGGQRGKRRCRLPGTVCLRKPSKGSALAIRACKFCCSGSFRLLSTSKGRCCNQEGVQCATTDQCCLGVCTNGTCQETIIVLPPPPPPDPPDCVPYGGVCTLTTDCCNLSSGIGCYGNSNGQNSTCRFT